MTKTDDDNIAWSVLKTLGTILFIVVITIVTCEKDLACSKHTCPDGLKATLVRWTCVCAFATPTGDGGGQ